MHQLNTHTHNPQVVNGPEVLSKWVGGSEENIRKLFKEAEEEQAERGDDSDLHIIIFDEIDAICKTRGTASGSTGVNDSVVNQLLSKIDGVDALNNILLIGMTNRLDMIDSALMRPGRLEVHVEIGLPDEAGRQQILRIHTKAMRETNRIDKVRLGRAYRPRSPFPRVSHAVLCVGCAGRRLGWCCQAHQELYGCRD